MKKTLSLFITCITLMVPFLSSSQINMWTWINGSDTLDQYGNYGTIGVAAPTNSPGSRFKGATWTDNSNNLWLFGGSGFSASGSGYLNDMWKYDITTNEWTWKKGNNSQNINGVYSGFVPSSFCPGGRHGAVTWKDGNGDLWLFGGNGYGLTGSSGALNDLWKYDVATNSWSWKKGANSVNQNGTYGTMGVSAAANTPGARDGAVSWVDGNNNLWLFGGDGFGASGGSGQLNDLWMYNIILNEWVWVNGPNSINQPPVYGTQGTPAASNIPGSRSNSSSFVDGNSNLWLFGGFGYADTASLGDLNDLWKYNISTNQWTWMKGSNLTSQNGTYGTQGVFAPGNTPGAKLQAASWSYNNELWIFGGVSGINEWNDLWKYDITLNQWAWVKGSNTANQLGNYGTMGVASAANIVGSRDALMKWMDNSGNLWLFGGYGYDNASDGLMNDLWKFVPCQAPAAPTISTPAANLMVCSNDSVNITAIGTGTLSWYTTSIGGTAIATGTNYTTPILTTGSTVSTYTYYAEDVTCSASNTRAAAIVTVNPLPVLTVASTSSLLCAGQSATLNAGGANTYSWNTGGAGVSIVITPSVTSNYTVTGTDTVGCVNSTVFTQNVSLCTGINEWNVLGSVTVFPNPFTNKITVLSVDGNRNIQVYNSLGELVYSVKVENEKTEINLNNQPKGIYFICIKSDNGTEVKKLIKQ